MDKYLEKGTVPFGMDCIKSDFSDIPLSDNLVDVLFAWEVLDHALTSNHFDKGVSELCRVLKPGGLLFFSHPLHNEPKLGHVVIKNSEEIIKEFLEQGMRIIKQKTILNEMKLHPELHKELCVTFIKNEPDRTIGDDVSHLISGLD